MIIGHQKEQEIIKKICSDYERGTFLALGPEGIGKFFTIRTILENLKDYEKIFFDTEEEIIKLDSAHIMRNLMSISTNVKRILVVNDAHKLNKEAQNSLLKILEEIKSKTLIFFVTHKPFKILPTIRSRMQKIFFKLVPQKEIFDYLNQEKNLKRETINLLLELFPGQLGKILRIIEEKEKLNIISKIYFEKDIFKKFLNLFKIIDKINLDEFLKILIILERRNLLKKDKEAIGRIKFLNKIYQDSSYFLNKELQISNILLNLYG